MYLQIIPLSASLGNRPLIYSIGGDFHEDITIWMLVHIPYGKKSIEGIVAKIIWDTSPTNHAAIRPLESIESFRPILAPYQITLIERIAQKYLLPIHRVASFFLTTPTQKRLKKQQYPIATYTQSISGDKGGIFLVQDNIVRPSHIHTLATKKSVIIVPDDIFLYQIQDTLKSSETLILTQEETETKKAQAWIDIANGKYQRIVWTRRLLYYNLWAYDTIVYIEDSFQHEYFHFPIRILYTDILAHIESSRYFSVKILTSIPRLSTLTTFHHLPLHHIRL